MGKYWASDYLFASIKKNAPRLEAPNQGQSIFPLIYTLATIFILIVPIIASPIESCIGIGITLTGIPVYFLFFYMESKPRAIRVISHKFTKICQKLLIVNSNES